MDTLLRRRAMIAVGGTSPTPPGPGPGPEPPTPTGVEFYDWLVFDGTAYIDTGIQVPANGSLLTTMGGETLKASQIVFIAGDNTNGRISAHETSQTTSTRRRFAYYYDSKSALSGNTDVNFSVNNFTIMMTPYRRGANGNYGNYTKGAYHPTANLLLGAGLGSTSAYTGAIGIFYVYGSDAQNAQIPFDLEAFTPYATFRPCTNNGVAGMYYVEQNLFLGNAAGSGTLSATNTI